MYDPRRGLTRTELDTMADKANERIARHRAEAEIELPVRPGPVSRVKAWLATVAGRRARRRGGPGR